MEGLFPLDRQLEITQDTRPLTQTSTIAVYIKLAEDRLFLQGFDDNERAGRPPTLLRGALVIRVLKPSRVKTIQLTFTGMGRTEWPEGIPPKRTDYSEENVLVKHTWPFYTHRTSSASKSGADMVKTPSDAITPIWSTGSTSLMHEESSSLSLDTLMSVKSNPLSLLKRVTSPSPERKRSSSIITATETASNGEFVFQPGDYVYNFEHPVPVSMPETIDCTFGSVNYSLEVLIERYGAFKSNITTKLPLRVVRAQSDDSVEDSEPIAISRDWEDQLHYDIIIASKAMVLNAYIPIAFKLIPLDKIKLHRIRIYLTENMEYWCRNKKVHRNQPTKKYLLLEHRAPPPRDLPADADEKTKKMGNLLTSDGYDLTAKEFEFQVYVPEKVGVTQKLHSNTTYENIKVHHWVKICLRLSRIIEGKPKHYEISIDSPIHILDSLCSHANTLLPAYGGNGAVALQNHQSNIYFPMDIIGSPPLSPEVEAFDHTPHHSMYLAVGRDSQVQRRARSSSSLSHTLPNFESTLSANVYKPETLDTGLTSPQATPLSPQLSPAMFSLDDDIAPPPFESFESPRPAPSRVASPLLSLQAAATTSSPLQRVTSGMSFLSIDNGSPHAAKVRAALSPARDTVPMPRAGHVAAAGIDAIMDSASPPLDPPDYEELMKMEIGSDIGSPTPPEIFLTRASKSPEDTPGDPGDLGSDFQFRGISPNMPDSVIRASSPARQRIRERERSPHVSARTSLDLNRSDSTLEPHLHPSEIDNVLVTHHEEDNDDEADFDVQEYTGSSREGRLRSTSRSRYSSRSSISPSARLDYEGETAGMEPLLQTTSTASESQFLGASYGGPFGERWRSRESLSTREPTSVDITAMYQTAFPSMSQISIFEPSAAYGLGASGRHPSITGERSGSNMSSTPIVPTLSDENVLEDEDESIKTKSEDSSLKDIQSSHSTLMSAGHEESHLQKDMLQLHEPHRQQMTK